tara:strand:- start:16 stop:510 length:495 start_codon:yes stop_codon:yes gene_type:complete
MGATFKTDIPKSLWTAQDSQMIGLNTVASIKLRTSKGISSEGIGFKKYSTKPIYISKRGARLAPKGGRPSRTGRSIFYQGGYAEYKAKSKKVKEAPVDLILSGILMNNLVLQYADRHRFIIGLTKHVQYYGYHVNAVRPFIGLTPDDVRIITEAVQYDIRERLK